MRLPAHRDPFVKGLRVAGPPSMQELTSGGAHLCTDLGDDGRHNSASAMLGANVSHSTFPPYALQKRIVALPNEDVS